VALATYGLGVVKGTAVDQVKLPAAAGAQTIGVTLRSADAGENVTIEQLQPGVDVEIIAGAAFAAGDKLSVMTNGRWHKPAASSGELQQLEALEAATGAGDVVTARVLADWTAA
jgi:hypothetical protein